MNDSRKNQYLPAYTTPEVMETFFDKTTRHIEYTKDVWKELMGFILSFYGNPGPEVEFRYSDLRRKLQKYGIWPFDK